MNEHIVIVTGNQPLPPHVVAAIPDEAIVLAADAGLDLAREAGLAPVGLIGDLDSVSAEGLDWAGAHTTISRHPVDKDRTDTELAVAFAAEMNPVRLTLVGGGDRLDHTLAAIGALGATTLTGIPTIDAWWDGQHLDVVHGPARATLLLRPGSTLSLIALHGPCRNVILDGVRWPLTGADLGPAVGLGVSNEVTAAGGVVSIGVSTGVLTVLDEPAFPARTDREKER